MMLFFINTALALTPLTCSDLEQMVTARLPENVIQAALLGAGLSDTEVPCLVSGKFPLSIVNFAQNHIIITPVAKPDAEVPVEATVDVSSEVLLAMTDYRNGDTDAAKNRLQEALKKLPGNTLLSKALTFLASPTTGIKSGGWKLTSDTDEMTGLRRLYASLPAINTVQGSMNAVRPTLYARCDDGVDMFIAAGSILNNSYGEIYEAQAALKLDDAPATTSTFGLGDDHDALFFRESQVVSFAKSLYAAKMLLVEADYYRSGDQVIKFDVTGANDILPLVLGACSRQ